MTMPKLIGYFGGTFDPIHCGHLQSSRELARQIGLERVTLMPNHVPPHRAQPDASAEQRLAMLHLAIAHDPLFTIDNRELLRATPSWTITTLISLRRELGNQQPLGFIIGQDSLLNLNHWSRWQELLNYCHLLVCRRPGYTTQHQDPYVASWIASHRIQDPQILHHQVAGKIFFANTLLHNISATQLRQCYRQGLSRQGLLPSAVDDYIVTNGLYRDK